MTKGLHIAALYGRVVIQWWKVGCHVCAIGNQFTNLSINVISYVLCCEFEDIWKVEVTKRIIIISSSSNIVIVIVIVIATAITIIIIIIIIFIIIIVIV